MPLTMPFQPIEWEESMATGIKAIDNQHHFLVDTLQQANANLLDDKDGVLLGQITKDLLSYAIMHFETEEALMQRYGYKDACPEEASNHISQHREFSRKMVTIFDQLREGMEVSRIGLLTFLNNWLRDHVLGIDQLLGKYLVQATGKSDSKPGS